MVDRELRGAFNANRLRRTHLDGIRSRLRALDPLAVLGRGYSVVRGPDGRVLVSAGQVAAGDDISVRLVDGELDAQVKQTRPIPDRGA